MNVNKRNQSKKGKGLGGDRALEMGLHFLRALVGTEMIYNPNRMIELPFKRYAHFGDVNVNK